MTGLVISRTAESQLKIIEKAIMTLEHYGCIKYGKEVLNAEFDDIYRILCRPLYTKLSQMNTAVCQILF